MDASVAPAQGEGHALSWDPGRPVSRAQVASWSGAAPGMGRCGWSRGGAGLAGRKAMPPGSPASCLGRASVGRGGWEAVLSLQGPRWALLGSPVHHCLSGSSAWGFDRL